MAAHLNFKEREEFARRLKNSLRSAGYDPGSPAQLRDLFRSTSEGKVISPSTAYKWLLGETLPDHRNMEVVARACGVCPDWLRTGRSRDESNQKAAA